MPGASFASTENVSEITCLSFSPNGRFLLSGSRDNLIVWNAHSKLQRKWFGKGADECRFMPDGRRVAVLHNGKVSIFDLESEEITEVRATPDEKGSRYSATGLSVRSDGKEMTIGQWSEGEDEFRAVVFGFDARTKVWAQKHVLQPRRGQSMRSITVGAPLVRSLYRTAVGYTPEGQPFTVSPYGAITLWDGTKEQAFSQVQDSPLTGTTDTPLLGRVRALAGGRFFLAKFEGLREATRSKTTFIQGRLLVDRRGLSDLVDDFDVDPHDGTVVAAIERRALVLRPSAVPQQCDLGVSARRVALAPDGRTAAFGGDDGGITLRRLEGNCQEIHRFEARAAAIHAVDARMSLLVADSTGNVSEWSLDDLRMKRSFRPFEATNRLSSVVQLREGSWASLLSRDGTPILAMTTESRTTSLKLDGEGFADGKLGLLPNGGLVLVDGHRLYDVTLGPVAPDQSADAPRVLPRTRATRRFDASNATDPLSELMLSPSWLSVDAFAIGNQSARVLFAPKLGLIVELDLQTGKKTEHELYGEARFTRALAYSPDDRVWAEASLRTIGIHERDNANMRSRIPVGLERHDAITALHYAGEYLWLGTELGRLQAWRRDSPKKWLDEREFGQVVSIKSTSDGRFLIVAHPDRVSVRELPSGKHIADLVDAIAAKLADIVNLRRDRAVMRVGDSIRAFEQEIGRGACVLIVLSKKYLESSDCCRELTFLYEHAQRHERQFVERIIPLVLEDVAIHSQPERISYLRTWERKKEELNALVERFGSARAGQSTTRELQDIELFQLHLVDALTWLSDVLMPRGIKQLAENDYAAVRALVMRRLELSSEAIRGGR